MAQIVKLYDLTVGTEQFQRVRLYDLTVGRAETDIHKVKLYDLTVTAPSVHKVKLYDLTTTTDVQQATLIRYWDGSAIRYGYLAMWNGSSVVAAQPPAPVVYLADDFNRANSLDPGNGWTRYRDDLGGGIVSGKLSCDPDGYDTFERTVDLAACSVSFDIGDPIGPSQYTSLILTTATGKTAEGAFGNGTYGGVPVNWWMWVTGQPGVYGLGTMPTTGDRITVTLDAAGTFTLAVNGVLVSSIPSTGLDQVVMVGVQLNADDGPASIDNFVITEP